MAPETQLHLTSHHRLPLAAAAARCQSCSNTNWKTRRPAAPPSVSGPSDWEPSSPISVADSSDKSDLSGSWEAFGDEICHKEPKYIVFGSSLGKLLQWCHCPSCGSVDIRQVWTTTGTLLTIHQTCDSCLQATQWQSQPSIGAKWRKEL
ncbi:hypothetical protein CesoFtcFv8_024719 [Champsocephalus esox]|uniref:Uncharacterized protein n=1 Tax=Champsocephalus esox TaxID=159716 RepID=A0AAN8B6I4_9TELE|nr:hypothetical protein CesoFtcFv8_024719 [Champsocephalus esox]